MRPVFPDLGVLDWWRAFLRKLPPGILWRQQGTVTGETYAGDGLPVPTTRFGRMLLACADEWTRLSNRSNVLCRDETRPDTTSELLPEWEAAFGLPEGGYKPTSLADRRAVVKVKRYAQGGQSKPYFEGLAAALGFSAVCTDGPWPHWWTVKAPAAVTRATCVSPCNASLVEVSATGLRLTYYFDKYRPFHTGIFWTHQ